MKLKGTIHQIQKDEQNWIFKFTQDETPRRVPFIFYSGYYEDGQECECYLESVAGIERAKPLFPLPNVTRPIIDTKSVVEKVESNKIDTQTLRNNSIELPKISDVKEFTK